MPLEIRSRIWRLVLGDRLIHLELMGARRVHTATEERRRCKHIVCRRDRPEYEMTENEIGWREPHQSCDHELSQKWGCPVNRIGHEKPDPESMHLTVLRVCRQTYNEANNVLWATNTFSFKDADGIFVDFMKSRTTPQKQLLRKLRLQMDWVYEDDKYWNRVLRMTLIRSLIELRSLRLQINHSMKAEVYQCAKARGNELGLFQMRQLEFVDKLAILPLTDVEVFVSDFPQLVDYPSSDEDEPPADTRASWTAEDRTDYAEGIRKILLDPKGADIYAQKQKVLQEIYREDRERKKEQQASRDAERAELLGKAEEYLRRHAPDLLNDLTP